MRTFILSLFAILGLLPSAIAETTSDPVQNFKNEWDLQGVTKIYKLEADINNDGLNEVIGIDETGVLYVWKKDGTEYRDGDSNSGTQGVFVPQLPGCTLNYSTPCVADIDNDGFLDLFVTNPGGDFSARPSFLYHNKADGTFEKVTSGRIATDSRVTFDATWADYDHDGYLDLFVGDFGDAKNALYHNIGGRAFDAVTAGPIVNDGGISLSSSWADYNNDGFEDCIGANLKPGSLVIDMSSSSPVGTRGLFAGEPEARACSAITGSSSS
jgi:hypothetical protein